MKGKCAPRAGGGGTNTDGITTRAQGKSSFPQVNLGGKQDSGQPARGGKGQQRSTILTCVAAQEGRAWCGVAAGKTRAWPGCWTPDRSLEKGVCCWAETLE